jgi:hypothetical protein
MKLKGIDGGPHKRWSMWFNSMIREEPYLGSNARDTGPERWFLRDTKQGAAWLSSARAVRCWVKSRNERNPYFSCQHVMMGTLRRLPAQAARKVGMTSSHHGLYAQGYTRATMAHTEGSEAARWSQSQKVRPSSD